MKLISLTLKNFRCFKETKLFFSQNNIVIQGENGSGKTSILEAIYFLSFLRSFRSSHLDDLSFQEPTLLDATTLSSFFISAQFIDQHDILHELSVGYAEGKKQVLLNKKKPSTIRDLFFAFPVFSITENDLDLVKGEPEYRRSFFDGSIAFKNKEYKKKLRELKTAIAQRNALLLRIREYQENIELNNAAESELHSSLSIWTHSLWTKTCEVERERGLILNDFQKVVQELLDKEFTNERLAILLKYIPKNRIKEETFEEFKNNFKSKEKAEIALARSLFGAHLDDIEMIFKQKSARAFASRGQQKLLIFLIKFAQYLLLKKECPNQGILLLDDFITDFDKKNLQKTINIIKNENLQTIFTCPLETKEIFPQENQVEIINFFKEKQLVKEEKD